MRRAAPYILVAALGGCLLPASFEPTDEAGLSLEEQVADHERRLQSLEVSTPTPDPDSPPQTEWRQLSHNVGVGLAHIRADICLEASQRDWKTFEEFSSWASSQIQAREAALYSDYKAALAREFPSGMQSAKFREILRQQAEGYRSVQ